MFEKVYNETLKDLPVQEISDGIVTSVSDGNMCIVSSPTGSGKTLILPLKIVDSLPEDERVVVLVPRKFLAINAAETVAELSDKTLGEEVGYAVGTQGGDAPLFNKNTKVIFATYGYAISSGMIFHEKNIVLDEVHEASLDMSIVKAIIKHRMKSEDKLNIVEMSATINLDKQKEYWQEFSPQCFEADGKIFDCKIIEDGDKSTAEQAINLILNHNRHGIAVFESGIADIQNTEEKIKDLLLEKDIKDVEVATIYGEMDKKERDKSLRAPKAGNKKIIIGTNVIESGMNIPWLDGGVSSGKGKDLFVTESGAVALREQNLPQWRLMQQKGRVARFTEGVFVLASYSSWHSRAKETTPEISRLPLTSLVMACAGFNLKVEDLTFDAKIDSYQLEKDIQKLKRLNLIDDDARLTELGKFALKLPVTSENAVVLKYAQSREYCLNQAIVMVAIAEQGNLRQNFKRGHGKDSTSDLFDDMKAFLEVDKEIRKIKQNETLSRREEEEKIEEIFTFNNVNKKRFYETKELIHDLRSRFGVRFITSQLTFDYDKLKQCLLAGNIERLSISDYNIFSDNTYNISNSSVADGEGFRHYLATPRVITPRHGGRPFTIYENVTVITMDDLKKYLSRNSHLIRYAGFGTFKILDSVRISNSELNQFIKEGFDEKINNGLEILNRDGIEKFKKYLQYNYIPKELWQSKLQETYKQDLIREVLCCPQEENKYDLYALLGIEKPTHINEITINEDVLRKFDLIKDGKIDIKINPLCNISFKIDNPSDIESVNINLVGNSSNALEFNYCQINHLNIRSENKNPCKIEFYHCSIQDMNLQNLSAKEVKFTYGKSGHVNIEDSQISELYCYDNDIDTLSLGRSKISSLKLDSVTFSHEIDFADSSVDSISASYNRMNDGSRLYIYLLDSCIVQSNLSQTEEQEMYNQVIKDISQPSADSTINIETVLNQSGLSDAYKQKAMVYANILKRRERIRKLGITVIDQIPDEMFKEGIPDERTIHTILSQQEEFSEFRKGDIDSNEMERFFYNPVKEKRRKIQSRRLEQHRKEIDEKIGLSTDMNEIQKRLEKIFSGDVWDGDAQLIREQNLQKKKNIRVDKQKAKVKEIAADALIEFLDDYADGDYDYFSEKSDYTCENAYSSITYDVRKNMKFDTPSQKDEFDQEIGDDGIKNIVKSLVAEMEKLPEDERYDFLADTAGYEPAETSSPQKGSTFSSLSDLYNLFHK